jgi:hypothetical protein
VTISITTMPIQLNLQDQFPFTKSPHLTTVTTTSVHNSFHLNPHHHPNTNQINKINPNLKTEPVLCLHCQTITGRASSTHFTAKPAAITARSHQCTASITHSIQAHSKLYQIIHILITTVLPQLPRPCRRCYPTTTDVTAGVDIICPI